MDSRKGSSREYEYAINRMVAEHGEAYTRVYLKTYCEVMLDDPQVGADTKTKIRSVLEFLSEYSN